MSGVSVRTKAVPSVRAELEVPGEVSEQLAYAAAAVDALGALGAGLFEPLGLHVVLACCDAEYGIPLGEPESPFHLLRCAAELPPTVTVPRVWTDVVVRETPLLDRAAILNWLGSLLSTQRCAEPDTFTGWTDLCVHAVRARLPQEVAAAAELGEDGTGRLLVSYGNGAFQHPVERIGDDVWAPAPCGYSDAVPFEVWVGNDGGALDLTMEVTWSPWIEDDGPGRPAVNSALERLASLGWQVGPFGWRNPDQVRALHLTNPTREHPDI